MMEITFNPQNYESVEAFVNMIEHLKAADSKGDSKAAFELAMVLDPYGEPSDEIPPEIIHIVRSEEHGSIVDLYDRAFSLLLQEAESGDGEAAYLVSLFYQTAKPPVSYDFDKFIEWNEKAFSLGYLFSGGILCHVYTDPNSKFFDLEKARRCEEITKNFIDEYRKKQEQTLEEDVVK